MASTLEHPPPTHKSSSQCIGVLRDAHRTIQMRPALAKEAPYILSESHPNRPRGSRRVLPPQRPRPYAIGDIGAIGALLDIVRQLRTLLCLLGGPDGYRGSSVPSRRKGHENSSGPTSGSSNGSTNQHRTLDPKTQNPNPNPYQERYLGQLPLFTVRYPEGIWGNCPSSTTPPGKTLDCSIVGSPFSDC